jgi:hypothetical protein
MYEILVPFRWRVWRFLEVKKLFQSCRLNLHCVLFLLGWREMKKVAWFVFDFILQSQFVMYYFFFQFGPYYFIFFTFLCNSYLSSISSFNPILWYIMLFNLVIILLISNVFSLSFCKFFICFWYHPSISICDFFF